VRKMKALTVKMETVTLIGKGRQSLTCFVYYMYAMTPGSFKGSHVISLISSNFLNTLFLYVLSL
jgi:hypothetical protein